MKLMSNPGSPLRGQEKDQRCLLGLTRGNTAVDLKAEEKPTLYTTKCLEHWMDSAGNAYKGLLVRRPFNGKWDEFQGAVDELRSRVVDHELQVNVAISDDLQPPLAVRLREAISNLLLTARLPKSLSDQIACDACLIGSTVASLCSSAKELSLKLEIFGENSCSRWHRDNYIGRGIVSYTGAIGTEYTRDTNVNFWELEHCGKNKCIIRDQESTENVEVGDMLFIKGNLFPEGKAGLVHKSPEKRYLKNGKILNRLMLKVDVESTAPVFQFL